MTGVGLTEPSKERRRRLAGMSDGGELARYRASITELDPRSSQRSTGGSLSSQS